MSFLDDLLGRKKVQDNSARIEQEMKPLIQKANARNVQKFKSGQINNDQYQKQFQTILGNGRPIQKEQLTGFDKFTEKAANKVSENRIARPLLTGLASLSPTNAGGEIAGYGGRYLQALGWKDGKYLAEAGDNVANYSKPTDKFANRGMSDTLINGGVTLAGDVINNMNPVTAATTLSKYFTSSANDMSRGMEKAGYTPKQSFLGGSAVALPIAALEKLSLNTIGGEAGGAVANKLISKIPQKIADNTVAKVGSRLTGSAITEGATEGLQELVANTGAKATFDPQRSLMQNVKESAIAGGILGAGARGGVEIMQANANRPQTPLTPELQSKRNALEIAQSQAVAQGRPQTAQAIAQQIQEIDNPSPGTLREQIRSAKNTVVGAYQQKTALPNNVQLSDNALQTLTDFGDYKGGQYNPDIRTLNQLQADAYQIAKEAGIDVTSGSPIDIQSRITDFVEDYKFRANAPRQGGFIGNGDTNPLESLKQEAIYTNFNGKKGTVVGEKDGYILVKPEFGTSTELYTKDQFDRIISKQDDFKVDAQKTLERQASTVQAEKAEAEATQAIKDRREGMLDYTDMTPMQKGRLDKMLDKKVNEWGKEGTLDEVIAAHNPTNKYKVGGQYVVDATDGVHSGVIVLPKTVWDKLKLPEMSRNAFGEKTPVSKATQSQPPKSPLESLKQEAKPATGARSDYSPENLQANRQIRAKNASSITYADKKTINPDELVTVYRAVPGKAKGGLVEGDWVTPNKEQARLFMKQSWAQDDTGAKIVTKKVKASELRYHADDAKGYVDDELLYVPKATQSQPPKTDGSSKAMSIEPKRTTKQVDTELKALSDSPEFQEYYNGGKISGKSWNEYQRLSKEYRELADSEAVKPTQSQPPKSPLTVEKNIEVAKKQAQATEKLKQEKKITPKDDGYWTTPVKGQAKDPIPNVKDVNGVQVKEGDVIEVEGLLGGKARRTVQWQEPQIANATGELQAGQWLGNGPLDNGLPFKIVDDKQIIRKVSNATNDKKLARQPRGLDNDSNNTIPTDARRSNNPDSISSRNQSNPELATQSQPPKTDGSSKAMSIEPKRTTKQVDTELKALSDSPEFQEYYNGGKISGKSWNEYQRLSKEYRELADSEAVKPTLQDALEGKSTKPQNIVIKEKLTDSNTVSINGKLTDGDKVTVNGKEYTYEAPKNPITGELLSKEVAEQAGESGQLAPEKLYEDWLPVSEIDGKTVIETMYDGTGEHDYNLYDTEAETTKTKKPFVPLSQPVDNIPAVAKAVEAKVKPVVTKLPAVAPDGLKVTKTKPLSKTQSEPVSVKEILKKKSQKSVAVENVSQPDNTLPVYKTKQVSNLDKVARSTRSIIERQGEAGKELAGKLETARDTKEIYLSKLQEKMPTVTALARKKNSLTNKDFENFVNATQELEKPNNAKVEQAVKEWQATHPEIRQRAVDAGLDVGDLGKTYYPHFIDYDTIFKDKNMYNESINHLVKTGQAKTNEEAIKLLGYAKDVSRNREFGNLEASRLIDLPFYDKTPNSLISYLNGSAKRITQVETFGEGDKVALKLIAKAGQDGFDTEAMKNAFDVAVGAKRYSPTASKVSGGIRKYVTTTRLGLGALTNVAQNVNTGVVTGHTRTLLSMAKQVDPKTRQFVSDTGVISDALLNDLKTQVGYSSFTSKVLGKAVNKITAPFFGTVEKFNRSVAATAGRDYALRLAQKGDEVTLRKLGVTGKITEKLTMDQQIQAARKIVEKTQFKVDPQDLPGWTDSPGGKLVAQFRTFSYNQGKFVSNEILKPAAKGNVVPLARLMAALPLGYALYELKRVIAGRPEEEDKKKEALSAFQNIGGAGLVFDLYQSLNPLGSKYIPSDRRASMAVGAIGGPAVGVATQGIGALSELIQRKNTPKDETRLDGKLVVGKTDDSYTDATPIARFGIQQLPVVGTAIKNRLLPFKQESNADAGKTTTAQSAVSNDRDSLIKTYDDEKTRKDMTDTEKTLAKFYKELPAGLSEESTQELARYERLNPNSKKRLYKGVNAQIRLKTAELERDTATGVLNTAQEFDRKKEIAKLEVAKPYGETVADMYGLSLYELESVADQDTYDKLVAYDKDLFLNDLIDKPKFKVNKVYTSKGGRGGGSGGSKKIDTTAVKINNMTNDSYSKLSQLLSGINKPVTSAPKKVAVRKPVLKQIKVRA